jgi:hypothetical protein
VKQLLYSCNRSCKRTNKQIWFLYEGLLISGAGAHDECATFEVSTIMIHVLNLVWVEAIGPEFIELDEILDKFFKKFMKPSNLLQ